MATFDPRLKSGSGNGLVNKTLTSMNTHRLHALVGRAAFDDDFQAGILNGHRAEFIAALGFSQKELDQLLTIQATSFSEFAAAVETIASGCCNTAPTRD